MEKSPRSLLMSFLEVIGTGISLGELTWSSELVISIILTIITALPTANRWSERWFTQDQ